MDARNTRDNGMGDISSDCITTRQAAEAPGVAPHAYRPLPAEGRKMEHGCLVFMPSMAAYEHAKDAAGRPRSGEPVRKH